MQNINWKMLCEKCGVKLIKAFDKNNRTKRAKRNLNLNIKCYWRIEWK